LEQVEPDLVLYDAGVDVHGDDRLGRLSLSDAGIRARDRAVLQACLGDGVPVVTVIGGGYDRDEHRLARRHGLVVETAVQVLAAAAPAGLDCPAWT
jgi:acetoin utilization deacetylase AcuC-like enzyme